MLTQPRQRTNVVTTAALLLTSVLAVPVLAAAPERALLCEDDGGQTVSLTAEELSATPVSSSEEMLHGHLLKPRTEAAVRGAFAKETPDGDDVIDGEAPEADESVAADPAIHSASKQKRPIYKRQMYRRDI